MNKITKIIQVIGLLVFCIPLVTVLVWQDMEIKANARDVAQLVRFNQTLMDAAPETLATIKQLHVDANKLRLLEAKLNLVFGIVKGDDDYEITEQDVLAFTLHRDEPEQVAYTARVGLLTACGTCHLY